MHRLDVVAVRIEQEGGVIAGMVGPLARRAVVPPAGGQPRLVEAVDRRAVRGLEGEMDAADPVVGLVDVELVRGEMVLACPASAQISPPRRGRPCRTSGSPRGRRPAGERGRTSVRSSSSCRCPPRFRRLLYVADLQSRLDLPLAAVLVGHLGLGVDAPSRHRRARRSGRRISRRRSRRRTLRVRVSSPSSASSSLCRMRKRRIWQPASIGSARGSRFTSSTWASIIRRLAAAPAPGSWRRRCCCARPSCRPRRGRC